MSKINVIELVDGEWKSVTRNMTPEEESQCRDEERRRQQEPPTWQETVEAQVTYTAMMTETMLEG